MIRPKTTVVLALVLTGTYCQWASADPPPTVQPPASEQRIRQSIERALPLLETASAETAGRRKCFTCHGQGLPSVVFVQARKHRFDVDTANIGRQLDHTYAHLKRSKERYADGRGTGGQVDTAGWALWGLKTGNRFPDDVTDAVVSYLLGRQREDGRWACSSNRPPSEKSDFTTTWLALRGLESFGRESDDKEIAAAKHKAHQWLESAVAEDTEDHVFQLLSLPYGASDDRTDQLTAKLIKQQRPDGGWAQRSDMDSDTYATATVLYALAEGGMAVTDSVYLDGIEFLLSRQRDDGSWYVKSRSKPFQTYFETGYPHQEDQFISMTAACWATIVLMHALPDEKPSG